MKEIVHKVWGREEILVNTKKYCGKHLILEKGYQCSLHCHKVKDETFYILEGQVEMEVGTQTMLLAKDMSVHIPPGTMHRFKGLSDAVILEISTHDNPRDSYRMEMSREVSPDAKQ